MPLLSLLVFVPLAGMLAVLALGRTKETCRSALHLRRQRPGHDLGRFG